MSELPCFQGERNLGRTGEFTKTPGWVNLLPMFGGALGGVVAGAVIAGSAGSGGTTYSTAAHSGSSPVKKTFGTILILGGLLFLVCAVGIFYNAWKIAQWVPKEVTAAELRPANDPKTYPGFWLAYTFEASKPAVITVMRQRLNHGGDVEARGLFVPVEDKWMFVSIAPGFEGNRLVGRLSPLDPALSKILIQRMRTIEPNPSALLPFEFNAVDGCDSDRRQRYAGAAVCAFLGLSGVWPGVLLRRSRRIVQDTGSRAAHALGQLGDAMPGIEVVVRHTRAEAPPQWPDGRPPAGRKTKADRGGGVTADQLLSGRVPAYVAAGLFDDPINLLRPAPGWTCRVASASDPRPVPARTSIRISSPRSVVRAVVAFSSSGLKMPSLRPLDWAFNPATALPTSTPGHHAATASAPHRRRQYRIQAAVKFGGGRFVHSFTESPWRTERTKANRANETSARGHRVGISDAMPN